MLASTRAAARLARRILSGRRHEPLRDRRHPGLPRRVLPAARPDRLLAARRPAVARRRSRQPRPGFARDAARSEGAGRRARSLSSATTTFICSPSPRATRQPHRGDTLAPILEAPDRDELIDWLQRAPARRRRGRAAARARRPAAVVDAGDRARCSRARSRRCSPADARTRLPRRASTATSRARGATTSTGYDRLRVVVNACTRLRFCTADGTMELREKRGPEHAPAGFAPWFHARGTTAAGVTVVCGHWSTLELMLDAERADARLRLPVGRHADRGQARRSPRVSRCRAARRCSQNRSDSGSRPRAPARAGAVRAREHGGADAISDDRGCARRSTRQNDADERRVARVRRRDVAGRRRRRGSGSRSAARDRRASTIGCSSEPWNGSSVVPSVVVPSGKIATTSPARAPSAALAVDALACPAAAPRSTNSVPTLARSAARPPASAASSALATKRAGCSGVKHEDVEPRNVVGDDQHDCRGARRAARRGTASRRAEGRSSVIAPAPDVLAAARQIDQRKHDECRRDALAGGRCRHDAARDSMASMQGGQARGSMPHQR